MGCSSSKNTYYGKSEPNLAGTTVVITGGSNGIGRATVIGLLQKRANVIVLARNEEKTRKVFEEMKETVKEQNSEPQLTFVKCELSDLDSVAEAVTALEGKKVDILINNAGFGDRPFAKTKQGFEETMGVNHFGHFALTLGMIEKGIMAEQSRVVLVSSFGYALSPVKINWDYFINPGDDGSRHKKFMSRMNVYCESKWANILFAKALAKKWKGGTAYSVHPGVIKSDFGAKSNWLYRAGFTLGGSPIEVGSEPSLYTALHPGIEEFNGGYFDHASIAKSKDAVLGAKYAAVVDEELEILWTRSLEATKFNDPFAE